MKIDGLLHVNIRCHESDLPAIERFYRALGIEPGYRPAFPFSGFWLYHGREPIIHISARYAEGSITKDRTHNGSVDHIAFRCRGASDLRDRLVRNQIEFEEHNVENVGYQIFTADPVGTRLEFNFPNEEAPDSVVLG